MFLPYLRPLAVFAMLVILGAANAPAQEAQRPPDDVEVAFNAALKAATNGPAEVALRELATIRLSDPYSFIPINEAAALMRAFGNPTGESFVGLIIPKQAPFWFVTINY